MKHYGLNLPEGSEITNLTTPTGTVFPANENAGELFYRTDETTLYVYSGSGWDALGGGGDPSYTSDATPTTAPLAYGADTLAMGDGAVAKEANNIAIGLNSVTGLTNSAATETGAIAIGSTSKAYELGCVSIGSNATTGQSPGTSNDPYGVAVGYLATADQGYTIAIGPNSGARGTSSVAMGYQASARESTCVAVGIQTQAGRTNGQSTNERAVAIGSLAKAYNQGCVSLGGGAISGDVSGNTQIEAIAIGDTANATLANTVAIGANATVSNVGELVIGLGTNAFEKKIVLQQSFTSATLTAFTNSPIVPANKAWKFTAQIIARQNVTGDTASYKIDGMIKNIAGTTTLVGTNIIMAEEEDTSWDCVIVANDTTEKLEIQFKTDGTADAVNVLANILIMEV